MRIAILLSALTLPLFGCPVPVADDDDPTPEPTPAPVAVGDVIDLEETDGVLSGAPGEAGSYLLVLFSAATDEGLSYGYGDESGSAPRSSGGSRGLPLPPAGSPRGGAVPPDDRSFRVSNGNQMVTVDAVLQFHTDQLAVYNDTTTPPPFGLDWDLIEEAASSFETIVMPRERQVFGQESDVEGTGRIDVLVSGTVNEYGAVAYVTGCDIAEYPGCGSQGNGSEVLYLSVPDPESSYASANAYAELMAHEVNHLIYGWHKYVQNDQLSAQENIYLTEGMSALAQDLSGYNNGNQYVWWSAVDASSLYQDEAYSIQSLSINDFLRGGSYYDDDRDGPLRGGAYLFLRYLFEQSGGMDVDPGDGTLTDLGGMDWLHRFFDAPETGVEAVEATTAQDVRDLAFDFYTCMAADGRTQEDGSSLVDDSRWNFTPRVTDPVTGYQFGVDMFGTFHDWVVMTGPLVQDLDDHDGWIRAGGAEILRVDLGEDEAIELAVDPAADARARLIRLE